MEQKKKKLCKFLIYMYFSFVFCRCCSILIHIGRGPRRIMVVLLWFDIFSFLFRLNKAFRIRIIIHGETESKKNTHTQNTDEGKKDMGRESGSGNKKWDKELSEKRQQVHYNFSAKYPFFLRLGKKKNKKERERKIYYRILWWNMKQTNVNSWLLV